jgi:hypothetical protein
MLLTVYHHIISWHEHMFTAEHMFNSNIYHNAISLKGVIRHYSIRDKDHFVPMCHNELRQLVPLKNARFQGR